MATIVLLHAFPVSSALWDAQAEGLRADGHTVHVPDLPGFGGTALPNAEPDLRHFAKAVLDGYEGAAVVAGLSMGGYVLMEILRQSPDRVAAAAFVDTKASADTDEARAGRLRVAGQVEATGHTRDLADAMIPALLGATTRAERPEVVQQVRAMIESAAPASVAWAQRAMAARPDSVSDLAAFRGPASIVWGDEDVVSPWDDQFAMRAVLPDPELEVVKGAGHLSAIEVPERVTEALRSLIARAEGR